MLKKLSLKITILLCASNAFAHTADELEALFQKPTAMHELSTLREIYEEPADQQILKENPELRKAFDLHFVGKMREQVYEAGPIKFFAYMAKKFSQDPAFISFAQGAAVPADSLLLIETFAAFDGLFASSVRIALQERWPAKDGAELIATKLQDVNFALFPFASALLPIAGCEKLAAKH